LLSFYQKMLKLRKKSKALTLGEFQLIAGQPKDVLYYTRTFENEVVSILLNMDSKPQSVKLNLEVNIKKVLLTNTQKIQEGSLTRFTLLPYQGIIFI
jgi:glycosidase